MLVLRDIVEIPVQPAVVFDWFRNLVDNYREWHPDHVNCRYIKGKPFEVGAVLYAEEFLHGRLHRLRLRLTSVEPDRAFTYRIAPALYGAFRITQTDFGSELEAEICIGWRLPVLGHLFDLIVQSLFKSLLIDLKSHMCEEGQNLSRLLGAREAKTRALEARPAGTTSVN